MIYKLKCFRLVAFNWVSTEKKKITSIFLSRFVYVQEFEKPKLSQNDRYFRKLQIKESLFDYQTGKRLRTKKYKVFLLVFVNLMFIYFLIQQHQCAF